MAKALTEVGADVMTRRATEARARRLNILKVAIVVGGDAYLRDRQAKMKATEDGLYTENMGTEIERVWYKMSVVEP